MFMRQSFNLVYDVYYYYNMVYYSVEYECVCNYFKS